jgi:hypothetical protein
LTDSQRPEKINVNKNKAKGSKAKSEKVNEGEKGNGKAYLSSRRNSNAERM